MCYDEPSSNVYLTFGLGSVQTGHYDMGMKCALTSAGAIKVETWSPELDRRALPQFACPQSEVHFDSIVEVTPQPAQLVLSAKDAPEGVTLFYDKIDVPPPVFVASAPGAHFGSMHGHTVEGSSHVASELSGYAHAVADQIIGDESAYALRPRENETLRQLCVDVYDTSYDNQGSRRKIDGNMRHWQEWCASMRTPMWRPDYRSLSAADQRRETLLAAGFIPWLLKRMRSRRGCGRAQPGSAFKVWLGVRRAHNDRDLQLSPSKLIRLTVKRLCRKHIDDFGAASLIPKRKEPFTRKILLALLTLAAGLKIGPYVLDWKTKIGRALRAALCMAASTGMRKAEFTMPRQMAFDRSMASRSNLTWGLRGRTYRVPPIALLKSPEVGDYAMCRPPLSKADQLGNVWGASPIYLSYTPNEPLCAFSALADMEIHDPLDADSRDNTPMFSPDGRVPFIAGHMDKMLKAMLTACTEVGAASATKYSWHSARIYLACSLLASGASHAQIQALCRWRSDEALAIYARLNRTEYAKLLRRALVADVNSVRTNQIPDIDEEDVYRAILHEPDANVDAAVRIVQLPMGRAPGSLLPDGRGDALRELPPKKDTKVMLSVSSLI